MNEKFDGNGIFPKGPKNDAYAQYFTGTNYLNMLTTEGVAIGNVVFEPGCRNNWHIHHQGGQILLVTGGAAGIRSGMNRLANLPPGTWSISRQAPNTGTVQPRIAGLRILPWRSRPRVPPMSGWNRYPTRITVNCHDKKATCQNGWLEINEQGRSMRPLLES